MADIDAEYRKTLETELSRRKGRNRRYSLRSFAKFLGVDVAYISKLMAGKIILSVDLAASFARRLQLSEAARKEFILSVAEEQKCHALYLIDPSLMECDPAQVKQNQEPLPRKKITANSNKAPTNTRKKNKP